MFTTLIFALSLLATGFGVAIPEVSGGAPAPPQFNITELGINGSGCPPGSAWYQLNDARTAVTMTFSQFAAAAGPGIGILESRKNCQATLKVHVPHGFSFAILDVDYRGYYQLDKKVKAHQDAIYYFQGEVDQAESGSTRVGPVSGANYVYRDEFNLTPTVYSPCGETTTLNINSQVRIDNSANRDGSGFIVNDSTDVSFTQTFNFGWLTC